MRDDKDRKTAWIITVWITKYALSRGIIKTTARMCDGKMIAFRLNDKAVFDSVAHGNDWHLTLDDAIARAEEMRQGKIASLRRQIASLEKRVFIVTGEDHCQDPQNPAST